MNDIIYINRLTLEQRMNLDAVLEAIKELREFDFYG